MKKITTFNPFGTTSTVNQQDRLDDWSFYNSKRWRTSSRIKRKTNPLCELCGTWKDLQVHHIIKRKKRPDLAYTQENLMTLCRRCHTTQERKDEREGQ